jgi:L-lactate dehydrogenase complex protein LldE
MTAKKPRVGLFVTCLVDVFRPAVGFAAVKLLEEAGCVVEVPHGQTCCGQPAYNSGDRADAAALARRNLDLFERYDYVVLPSGSCAAMIRHHYPALLRDDPELSGRTERLAAKTWELMSFLTDVMKVEAVPGAYDGKAAYHDSCSGLRELGIKEQPRRLLGNVDGLELLELSHPEECCGFGGTFCVKYPEISDRMVTEKVEDVAATGADTLLAGDLGCLMNMAGKLKRIGKDIKVRHAAEVLAGIEGPAIGEAEEG